MPPEPNSAAWLDRFSTLPALWLPMRWESPALIVVKHGVVASVYYIDCRCVLMRTVGWVMPRLLIFGLSPENIRLVL